MRSQPRPRKVNVRIELPPGVVDDRRGGAPADALETRPVAVPSAAGGREPTTLRFESSHVIELERGGRGWSALERSLTGPPQGSDLYFVVIDAQSGGTIGEAGLRLQSLVDERTTAPTSVTLQVLDTGAHARAKGSIVVHTDGAIDALRAIAAPASARGRQRPSSSSSAGGRDEGSAEERRRQPNAEASIEFGVQQVRLGSALSRYPNVPQAVSVRVEARCLLGADAAILETEAQTPERGGGSAAIRMDWVHHVGLDRGSREWERLGIALGGAPAASDVLFVLRDPARGRTLGQAKVNLKGLLEANADEAGATSLRMVDAVGATVAEALVSVRALEALTLIREDSRGGAARDSPGRAKKGSESPGGRGERAKRGERVSGEREGGESAEVTLSISDLRLQPPPPSERGRGQAPSPRSVCVRVEALGMEDAPLETRALAPAGGSVPLRFGWSHTLRLARGERAWDALSRAIDDAARGGLQIFFVVVDAAANVTLGEASYDLAPLAAGGVSRESSSWVPLEVRDRHGGMVGTLNARVRALDAIDKVRAPPPRAARRPPRRVEELSVKELHAVLQARGVGVPAREGSRSWYLDACNKERIRQLSAEEVDDAVAKYAEREGGAERGGGRAGAVGRQGEHGREEGPASIEIAVEEVQLSERGRQAPSPRSVCVRVEALGMEDAPLETRALAPAGGSVPLRFGWSHTLRLARGERAWDALSRAIGDEAALRGGGDGGRRLELMFVVVDAGTGQVLGEAPYDLSPLTQLRPPAERPKQRLQLLDSRNLAVGHALVSVRAHEAIQAVMRDREAAGRDRARGGMVTVSVTVPPMHMPGERVQVEANGQTYDVDVPRGLRPGQRFDTEIPAPPRTTPASTAGARDAPHERRDYERRDYERRAPSERASRQAQSDSLAATLPAQLSSPTGRSAKGRWGVDAAQPSEATVDGRRSARAHEAPSNPKTRAASGAASGGDGMAQTLPSHPSSRMYGDSDGGGGGGISGLVGSTAPTEVEHALIVAFERLGQAQHQISTTQTSRARLERDLAQAREQVSAMGAELKVVKAERDAQAQRLAQLGSKKGVGGGDGVGAGAQEAFVKRLGKLQAAKEEEVRALNRQLAEAHEEKLHEVKERQRAERQAADALRRLEEVSAALDMERRHAQAVGLERERLSTSLSEAQLRLHELTLLCESEHQMRLLLEDQGVVLPPDVALSHTGGPSTAGGRAAPPPSARAHLAASLPVRGGPAAAGGRSMTSHGASRAASRGGSPHASKAASPSRERGGAPERHAERGGLHATAPPGATAAGGVETPAAMSRRWASSSRAAAGGGATASARPGSASAAAAPSIAASRAALQASRAEESNKENVRGTDGRGGGGAVEGSDAPTAAERGGGGGRLVGAPVSPRATPAAALAKGAAAEAEARLAMAAGGRQTAYLGPSQPRAHAPPPALPSGSHAPSLRASLATSPPRATDLRSSFDSKRFVGDREKQMAERMRLMATDLASALDEPPPLALRYKHAVERRDGGGGGADEPGAGAFICGADGLSGGAPAGGVGTAGGPRLLAVPERMANLRLSL